MSLVDELSQKQALKFQLNKLNPEFIENKINENKEGIFYLSSDIKNHSRKVIMSYLEDTYKNTDFELNEELPTNYEIMFKNKN